MTFKSMYILSALAGTLLGAVAHAEPHWTSQIGNGTAATIESGGTRTTHADPARPSKPAESHWTSQIGNGSAAALESRGRPAAQAAPAATTNHSEAHWTSRIGTGGAGKFAH